MISNSFECKSRLSYANYEGEQKEILEFQQQFLHHQSIINLLHVMFKIY